MAECWEPVANLIRRWSGTGRDGTSGTDGLSLRGGGGGGLFVLAFVDELPIDVQQRCLDLIRQRAPFAKVPGTVFTYVSIWMKMEMFNELEITEFN